MKSKLLCIILTLLCLLSSCGTESETDSTESETASEIELTAIENGSPSWHNVYKNPDGVNGIGDPSIIYCEENSTYYMYATSAGDGYYVWKSKSCADWTCLGYCFKRGQGSYGATNYWAPEVYYHGGLYYMVYSSARYVNGNLRYAIGCAVSENPEGPFEDIVKGEPLFNPDYSVIDANLLFDDDGRIYLFFSRDCSENTVDGHPTSQIYGIEVKADLTGTIGKEVFLTTPDHDWEFASGYYLWNEGPCVIKHNGTYYLMYSAGCYANETYAVGYATSESPLGTYTKYEKNPILQGDGESTWGTGHNNIFVSPDGTEIWCVYHSLVKDGDGDRQLNIDRLWFDDDGTLCVNAPTVNDYYPSPSGTGGVYNLHAEDYTVSTSYSVKTGNISLLGDGKTVKCGTALLDVGKDGGSIDISISEPCDLNALYIYASADRAENFTADVIVNGTYKISGVKFGEFSKSAFAIFFTNLPEDVKVSTVKIELSSEKSTLIALSEIMLTRE